MKLLKKLYSIWSPSMKEQKMIQFIKNYVSNIEGVTVKTDKTGNLYLTKGESETYPCVVAHLDQVQKLHPKDFIAIETKEIIFGYSHSERSQIGLGADDKNGIWVALKCLKKFDNIKCAFFIGEETGCVGSDKADLSFFMDCRFVLECDRRGSSDFITDISGTELCSKDFINDCSIEKFGYKEHSGLMTDVDALKENELAVSCCNMSCGYYEPHTDHEFTVKSDLYNCLHLVYHIIENCTKVYPHEYKYVYSGLSYGGYYGGSYGRSGSRQMEYDELYCELWDLLDMNPGAYTLSDIKTWYKPAFPHLTDSDFKEIYESVSGEIESYRNYQSDHNGRI